MPSAAWECQSSQVWLSWSRSGCRWRGDSLVPCCHLQHCIPGPEGWIQRDFILGREDTDGSLAIPAFGVSFIYSRPAFPELFNSHWSLRSGTWTQDMVPCLLLPFGATFQTLSSTSHPKEPGPHLDGMGTHPAPSRLGGSLLSLKPPWGSQSRQDPRVLGGILRAGRDNAGGDAWSWEGDAQC